MCFLYCGSQKKNLLFFTKLVHSSLLQHNPAADFNYWEVCSCLSFEAMVCMHSMLTAVLHALFTTTHKSPEGNYFLAGCQQRGITKHGFGSRGSCWEEGSVQQGGRWFSGSRALAGSLQQLSVTRVVNKVACILWLYYSITLHGVCLHFPEDIIAQQPKETPGQALFKQDGVILASSFQSSFPQYPSLSSSLFKLF